MIGSHPQSKCWQLLDAKIFIRHIYHAGGVLGCRGKPPERSGVQGADLTLYDDTTIRTKVRVRK